MTLLKLVYLTINDLSKKWTYPSEAGKTFTRLEHLAALQKFFTRLHKGAQLEVNATDPLHTNHLRFKSSLFD
ncbi:hypothetical protein HNQ92_005194 [Rhabdobacter roseus]|uniref:Uncharacterized protein n=1 Tax=Rhabdobacter roseus TaxID=1655419 RepID=A0A840TZH6_9BACT|nr:hypothetical protein [Rhabdobacter roseus]